MFKLPSFFVQLNIDSSKDVPETERERRSGFLLRLPKLHRGTKPRLRVKIMIWSGWLLVIALLIIMVLSYITNPFAKFNIVRDEFGVELQGEQLTLVMNSSPIVRNTRLTRTWAFTKSGYHMAATLIDGGDKIPGETVDEIIANIHQQRFSPDLPFLISGDHFAMVYPRSLGIFYHSLIDPRTALDQQDWYNRQAIYLKTLAFSLAVYNNSDQLSTTIVPLGPQGVVLLNVYAPPSDTLYSLLWGLMILKQPSELSNIYPIAASNSVSNAHSPQAQTAAVTLLSGYREMLQRYFSTYWNQTYDPVTGLVRKDIVLSGTKDSVKRYGSFYDNVIAWKTHQLAQQLGLIAQDQSFLDGYKQRILDAFWVESTGYFREEQGIDGQARARYSSDWLIAYQTGFLTPSSPNDLPYLEKAVRYIQDTQLDKPFGLRFSYETDTSNFYWPVKWGTPEYVTTAIWSHWGMEYTKLLAHLTQITGNSRYLESAQYQIEQYSHNIVKYNGFPELYTTDGQLYQDRFYRSVRATGWVINFELARKMVENVPQPDASSSAVLERK